MRTFSYRVSKTNIRWRYIGLSYGPSCGPSRHWLALLQISRQNRQQLPGSESLSHGFISFSDQQLSQRELCIRLSGYLFYNSPWENKYQRDSKSTCNDYYWNILLHNQTSLRHFTCLWPLAPRSGVIYQVLSRLCIYNITNELIDHQTIFRRDHGPIVPMASLFTHKISTIRVV